ncbi:MAG: prepilin peptidase [Erysipelotrichaceae bacterium]|nr:prepilin peptidase [Erysipelotrichaceae bacterium]
MRLFLIITMLGISFFDFRYYIIPDLFHVILVFSRMVISDSMKEFYFACLNGIAIAFPLILLRYLMNRILHQECMGDGDIKLVFSFSIYFHLLHDLYALLFASVIGLCMSLLYLRKKERMIPFGPCICGGFLIMMLMRTKLF